MATYLSRALNYLEIANLNASPPAPIVIENVTEISAEPEPETQDRKYFDSFFPGRTLVLGLGGNVTIKGDIEKILMPKYSGGTKSEEVLIINNFYLIQGLALDNDASGEMGYFRWTGQLVSVPKPSLTPGEVQDKELTFRIITFENAGYAQNIPYDATDGTASSEDPTPTGAYDPAFWVRVPDGTKTIAAAVTHSGGTDPFTRA